MMRITGILCLLWLSLGVYGQQPEDTVSPVVTPQRDTVGIETYTNPYSPRRALLLSAVCPGAGQIYNRRYWKVPLVYGGFAAGIYMTKLYHDQHNFLRSELFGLLADDLAAGTTSTGLSASGYTEQTLRNAIDKFRRERDFYIILLGFWYILQMVDAHVDAHLKEFKLNPQLRLSCMPAINRSIMTGTTAGIGLTLRF